MPRCILECIVAYLKVMISGKLSQRSGKLENRPPGAWAERLSKVDWPS